MTRAGAARRAIELAVVFVGLPVAFRLGPPGLPKIPALLVVTAACGVALARDRTFDRTSLHSARGLRTALPGIAARGLVAAAVVLAAVLARGGELLDFPRHRPSLWALVLVLYPVLSAWPQELVYRTFFFHRYGPLLGPRGTLAASALAFSLLHVVYADPIAPALALPAGFVLASTYSKSGSLYAVALEHALYGTAVFTLGLGRAFFVGAR
jgi:membrane protease YdiL (CAAX protease family)